MKKILWLGWGLLSLLLMVYLGYQLLYSEDKTSFIVGEATHGHHQIEMACESCHSDPFGGPEVLQDACTNCHADELAESRDDHPKKKFTNPRNAELLKVIDARQCISCHTEHQSEQTHPMGVTLPNDYCYHCHQEVGENRPSHKDLPFDSCATAGCHNFHDNRALYEDFLIDNANQPWLKQISQMALANHAKLSAPKGEAVSTSIDVQTHLEQHPDIHQDWQQSAHADANVQCVNCHLSQESNEAWVAKPGLAACQTCHADEVVGFTQSKHGMRLSPALSKPLSPLTPAMARLDFHDSAAHKTLSCNSCHDVHQLDTKTAAAESCLSCHADDHSQAYLDSPHGKLWQKELAGEGESGSGVSCATCHMPRMPLSAKSKRGEQSSELAVQHNQNATLRPNEKMIRPVCMQCHSLEFSIDALADEALIESNFTGQPSAHVESIDWALRRVKP